MPSLNSNNAPIVGGIVTGILMLIYLHFLGEVIARSSNQGFWFMIFSLAALAPLPLTVLDRQMLPLNASDSVDIKQPTSNFGRLLKRFLFFILGLINTGFLGGIIVYLLKAWWQ